jgi:Large ribosomal RNA subunit accumulation protein YceD
MKQSEFEFSRPLPVDRVPNLGSRDRISAEPAECENLALRFGIPKIHALSAFLTSLPWRGGGLKITGPITAEVEQVSVVSLESFRTKLEIAVERYFLPPHKGPITSEEDVDIIHNGIVDLGEIVAETLALELDPYPRMPGEVFEDIQEDVDTGKVTPFAALAKLAPKSGGGKK